MLRGHGGVALVFGVAFLGLAFVLVSLFGNLLASFSDLADFGALTFDNYVRVIGDDEIVSVSWNTIVLGTGSVAVMMVFSFPICWILARTDFRWKGTVLTLLTAKLAIPGFITAMTYVWLFNPTSGIVNKLFGATQIGAEPPFDVYTLEWICFLQGVVLTPACVFMLLPAFQNLDATLEEAAWVSGVSRLRTVRRVVLPVLAPAVFAATLFFFVVAVEIFDFVGLIGMPGGIDVLSIWIFDATHPVSGLPDYGFAASTGMLLFVLSGIAIVFYMRFLRQAQRFAVIKGKGRIVALQPLGAWQWAALGFIGVWVLLAFAVPVVTLVWVAIVPFLQVPSLAALDSLNLKSFGFAFAYLPQPLMNTFAVMAGSVVLAIVWSACISWVVTRSRSPLAKWTDALVFLSPAVPSMVAAVAFQYLGIAVHQWLPLYGSIWLIAIAMGTRMLAFCTRTLNGAALQIHMELDEAAYVSGVSRMTAFRRVFLPIVAPAIFYSALMVGMLSARDLTLPLMMNVGSSPLVSTLIFDLQTNGDFNVAAAIGLYMIVVLVLLLGVARWITGLGEHGFSEVAQRRGSRVRLRLRAPRPATA